MKQTKSNKSIIVIVIIIVILFILVLLLSTSINYLNNQNDSKQIQDIKQYVSINDFKSIEEVAIYLDCIYIKEEVSKQENYNTDIYMKIKVLPYEDDKSNEGFYDKLISYSAKVLEFKNFRIIDKENDTTIEVICNKENKEIKDVLINGESNYFNRRDSQLQIRDYKDTKITDFTIQSEIINKLINNNWKILDSEIGTKESTFNSYDIYFDEGIELRKINNQVFNIVFTDKYKLNIVNNITTAFSKEEIIRILGNPTFSNESTGIIGYKGKDIYVFFNTLNKQISIYMVEKDTNISQFYELYKKSKEENKSITQFINILKEKMNNYDYYKETNRYIELQYTLKGIKLQFNVGDENGILLYNNYLGFVYDDTKISDIHEHIERIPKDIFLKNENLVFLNEINRVNYTQSVKYMARMEKNRNKKENEIESKLFIEYKNELQDEAYSISFISIDGNNPNSELKDNISSGLWLNDKYYVYGIKQRGIYIYDVLNRKYVTLFTGENVNYNIKEYKNKILTYDDKSIKLDL